MLKMVRSVLNPSVPQIFLLFCVYFTLFGSISIPSAHGIHLGNETDRLALLAFKDQLHDPHQAMSSWNATTHFCEWEGVTCSRRHQRVVWLNLSSQGLAGSVSPYIGNLSLVRAISLRDNNIQGNIPQEISKLSRLQILSLSKNSFVGQLPANLVECSNLEVLFLDSNEFSGEIPSEFGSFTKLLRLILEDNYLTGKIPDALGNISSLQTLTVQNNNLDGSIPNSLGKLKELKFLAVGQNLLSGLVPPSIYNLSAMQTLDLDSNQFQGSLPPSIGQGLPNLLQFHIGGNQFSGIFRVSLFSNASQLSYLDAQYNSFVGDVPIEIGNLKELKYLNLGYNYFGSGGKNDDLAFITSLSNCSKMEFFAIDANNFGGRLPASLTNLSITLNTLYLSDNQIFGSIPSDIWKFENLVLLEASNISLTGTIPNDIGMLQNLQYLGLGNNRLSGKIPNTVGNLTSLYWLYLPNNMLDGNIEPSLGKCFLLQKLEINDNLLTGNIPKQVLGLSLLEVELSSNYLNGSLPPEVGELKNLQYLNISRNKLSGEIPTTLGSCFSLEKLNLSGNSFQGPIPSSFADLVAIEIIDLSRNNLSGKIPRNLENLHHLRYLNISFNNVEGEVPTKGIFQNVTGFLMVENDKLCGGSSKLKLRKCSIQKAKRKRNHMTFKVAIGVLVPLSVIGTLLVLLTLHLRKKSTAKSVSERYANELQRISYNEIREATNGFSSSNLIGKGSSASVYKGVLREGGSVIAVKVFNLMERGAAKSFKAECEILRKIRHRNLLKILTVCSSIDFNGNDFKALILEFMPYGSLEDWLYPSSDKSQRPSTMLNILQRLNIAIDIATALDYLHNFSHTPIVHCDLKPRNVLLDDDLVACVGDFGLAKFLGMSYSGQNKSETISNAVRGTVGYIPPEYGMGSKLSTKGDVYSYGIMLLEMFTGRRPTDEMFNDTLTLHNFCKVNLGDQDVGILSIIPPVEHLPNDTEADKSMTWSMKKCLLSVIEVGIACSSDAAGDRMEIKDVLMKIQKIKEVFIKIMNSGENTNMELRS